MNQIYSDPQFLMINALKSNNSILGELGVTRGPLTPNPGMGILAMMATVGAIPGVTVPIQQTLIGTFHFSAAMCQFNNFSC